MQKELNTQKIELIHHKSSEQKYPYIGNVQAGFPSPADDFSTIISALTSC